LTKGKLNQAFIEQTQLPGHLVIIMIFSYFSSIAWGSEHRWSCSWCTVHTPWGL